ncbi:MAG: TlpA family protein disulfide reductase [Deltaproteobacteria bacterium]|nr:TlpA family protein disulfide reductase [Deltaproteobacteria bacterium]
MKTLAIVLLSVVLAACESGKTPRPQAGRFIAVTAKSNTKEVLTDFCDVIGDPDAKRIFKLPEMDGNAIPSEGQPLWVNVWATWCKPCIEEMPVLVQWQNRLREKGTSFVLQFISVDESLEITNAFLKKRPQIPASLHLKDPEALPSWIQQLGLDHAAGLPIHIFVDAQGAIRCVRAAAITAGDYATVAQLLKR